MKAVFPLFATLLSVAQISLAFPVREPAPPVGAGSVSLIVPNQVTQDKQNNQSGKNGDSQALHNAQVEGWGTHSSQSQQDNINGDNVSNQSQTYAGSLGPMNYSPYDTNTPPSDGINSKIQVYAAESGSQSNYVVQTGYYNAMNQGQ